MNPCEHYCHHGGHCGLPANHDGRHNASGMCLWSDAESIPKEQADRLFIEEVHAIPDPSFRTIARLLYPELFVRKTP